MQGRRALTYSLGAAFSVAAILAALAVAGNCDAPGWQKEAAGTVLPLTAAIGAGVAAGAWSRRRFLAVVLGLSIGAATLFASVLLSVGCTT